MTDDRESPREQQLATALAEVLAYLHSLTRVGGSVIGYQTVNTIPAGDYERWQGALDKAKEN